MEHPAFCVNCGQKLTPDIKFCPKCGTKIYTSDQETMMEKNQNEVLYAQYQKKVENAVAEAYLSDIKLNKNNLYVQGEKYNYTKEKIDSIISMYEGQIKEYIAYLRKMYLEEDSLLMKVTDEIKEECSGYAEFLGLDYSEGEDIFDKFITDNKIREKSGILMALLTYYGDTGKFEEVKSNAGDTVMDSFKKKEYIRLKNAVEQLLNLQKELHKKSSSIYLSEEDEKKIAAKACTLGFQQDDGCIYEIIRGNEIKLGYSLKQEIEIRNKSTEENKNRLSRIVPSKTVMLMGKKCEFGSCYFVEKEIKIFYKSELSILKKKTIEMIQKYNVHEAGCGGRFTTDIAKMLFQWGTVVEKFNNKAGISQNIYQDVKDYYKDAFFSFTNDLEEIKDLFYDIEQGVEATRVKGRLNKALRGRWVVAGIGLNGMVNSAITQSVLNAGTGLAYDAINGVSESVARHNSQKAKEELRDSIIPVVAKFWDMLIDTTPEVYMELLCEKYPFIIWHQDEEFEGKLLEEYKISDEPEKTSKILELIFVNPYNPMNYVRAFYKIQEEEHPEKDADSLMKIAQWFSVESKVVKEIFTMMFDNEEEVSKDTCIELLRIEKLLQFKYTPTQNKIYKKYLETEIEKTLLNYKPEEINAVLELLKNFNREYEYSTDFLEGEVQRKVFSHYDIGTNPRTIEDLSHTIQQLKYLDETCSWKFKKKINNLEKRLEDLLEKKDKESRTVEAIQNYDIASKKVQKKKILAQSAEIKDKMVLATPNIEEKCMHLSLDMEKTKFDAIIKEIMVLCTESQYDSTFVADLQEQWGEADKIARTVQGVEYTTKEEAANAEAELKEIEKIYEDHKKSVTQKYLCVMNCSFKTDQARKKVLQKEQELIEQIDYFEKNKSFDATYANMNNNGKIIKPLVITGVMFVLNIIFSSGLLKALCVIVAVGMWSIYAERNSERKKSIEAGERRAESCKKGLAEFKSVFKIVDNHVVPKNK